MKFASMFFVLFIVIFPAYSMENQKVIYRLPEMSSVEMMLEDKIKDAILQEMRDAPLAERLAALRLVTKLVWLEDKVEYLRRNQGNMAPSESQKIAADIKRLSKEIQTIRRDPQFVSDWASDDLSKVFENRPFSLKSEKKIQNALKGTFYRIPYRGDLQVNTKALPANFFPLKFYILKAEDARTIILNNSRINQSGKFVVALPEDIVQSTTYGVLPSHKKISRFPTSYCYPKSTFKTWTASTNAYEVANWNNLMRDNILGSEFVEDNWKRTFEMEPSYRIDAQEEVSFMSFAVYTALDDEEFLNNTDMLIVNNAGDVCYWSYCFQSGMQTNYNISFSLTTEDFKAPAQCYVVDAPEAESEESEDEHFPLNLDESARQYIQAQDNQTN